MIRVDSARPAGEAAPGVLVADDDPALLNLLEVVLRGRGFAVWPARDGRAAVELFRRHREDIAVVLLDVRMPGLDGVQALAELRRLEPGLACCLMSGHTGAYDPAALEELGALRLYEKPFSLHGMADELWQLARQRLCRTA